MNRIPSKNVESKVQTLYRANSLASRFFDALASRQRDATATTIEQIARVLNSSLGDALKLAREIEETGAADLYLGRRGAKTRLVWKFSCISIGRIAVGEETELEQPENPVSEDEEAAMESRLDEAARELPGLTIPQAKRLLAKTLGVNETNIEISVRA